VTGGRTSGEGHASDKLTPKLRDNGSIEIIRGKYAWLARRCLQRLCETALQNACDPLANISNVGCPSTEVFVVHSGEGVRLHGRRLANGFQCVDAVIGDRAERRFDKSRISGEHRLGLENRRDLGAGSGLGLICESGELLRGALEGRS